MLPGRGKEPGKVGFQNLPKMAGYTAYYIKNGGFALLKVTIFTESFQRCFRPTTVCATQTDFIIIFAITHNNIMQVNLSRLFEIFL